MVLTQSSLKAIDKVAPSKDKNIKNNCQEWFDSEISEKLKVQDKCLRNTEYLDFK